MCMEVVSAVYDPPKHRTKVHEGYKWFGKDQDGRIHSFVLPYGFTYQKNQWYETYYEKKWPRAQSGLAYRHEHVGVELDIGMTHYPLGFHIFTDRSDADGYYLADESMGDRLYRVKYRCVIAAGKQELYNVGGTVIATEMLIVGPA